MDKLHGNDLNRIARFQRILDLLVEPTIMTRLAEKIPNVAYDTTRLDCNELVLIGYISKNSTKLRRGRVHEFMTMKPILDIKDYRPISSKRNETFAETMKLRKERQPSGGTIVRLTETTHWTPRATKQQCAWIGNTLSTMTF